MGAGCSISIQNQDAVFGKITCTGVEVVDLSGNPRCIIYSDKHGGRVAVFDEEEGRLAGMVVNEQGGNVSVRGSE